MVISVVREHENICVSVLCFPKWIVQTTMRGLQHQNLDKIPNGILLMSIFQRRNLFMLFGKNPASDKKIAVVEHLRKGKDFQSIAIKT